MADEKDQKDQKDGKSDSDPLSTTKEATGEAAKEYTKTSSEAAKQYAEESVEATKKFTESSMEATRHFAEKARAIGGKTPEIASHVLEQSTKITRDVFGKIHEGWSTAYDASSKFMQEAYHTTSAYAERHKSTVVMKKLTAEREKLNQKLGSVIYTKYKNESVSPQEIFELQEIRDILDQCENVDNEVLRIGKELDKK